MPKTTESLPLLDPARLGWRPREWAAMTGVQQRTVYMQIRRGTLKSIRAGDTLLIPRSVAIERGLIDA